MFPFFVFILLLAGIPSEAQANNHTRQEKGFKFLSAHGTTFLWKHGIARTVVSLTPRSPEKFYGSNHFCGGVVITPKHILTAAVCLFQKKGKVLLRTRNIIAVAGWQLRLHYSYHMTRRIRAHRLKVQHQYLLENSHNVAIIVLEKSFPMKISAINLARLPDKPAKPGDNCLVLGWGRAYKKGPLSNELKSIELTLRSSDECKKLSPNFHEEDHLCAVDTKFKIMTPCPGDMGSPMFCNDILYGITATTDECQNENPVSLFSNIFYHKEWIKQAIGAAEPSAFLSKTKPFVLMIIGVYMFT